MYIFRIFVFIVFIIPFTAKGVTTYGYGTDSCGTWIKERKNKTTISKYHQVWVLGFISGSSMVLEAHKKIQNKTDVDAVVAYVDKYCSDKPLADISEASQMLVVELLR